MKKLIPQKLKNIYHLANAVLANVWFGFPSKKIKVIVITGTNGKTTTVQMAARILQDAGCKIAVASTINFQIGDRKWINKTKFTTLNSWKVQRFIKRTVAAKCEYLVLEVSSHSLDQNRVWGMKFDAAAITNVTREHLDYHKTMEQYRKAKLKLFKMIKSNGAAVVNLEMERPEEFLDAAGAAMKYCYRTTQSSKFKAQNHSSKLKTISANNIELTNEGSAFLIKDIKFRLKLPGEFNIENALAAVCVGLSQKISLEEISDALKKIEKIPGRMDQVENDRGIKIIIDYAVTPDSMQKLGKLIQNSKFKIQNSKLIWVFGSCGERDRGKRPIMGEIVAKYADFAIVTNEDPYNENPQRIIDEVFAGVLEGGKRENVDAWKIFDRKNAIKKALELACRGDTVLITGKGAEETMAVGDKRVSWNDKNVAKELLREMS